MRLKQSAQFWRVKGCMLFLSHQFYPNTSHVEYRFQGLLRGFWLTTLASKHKVTSVIRNCHANRVFDMYSIVQALWHSGRRAVGLARLLATDWTPCTIPGCPNPLSEAQVVRPDPWRTSRGVQANPTEKRSALERCACFLFSSFLTKGVHTKSAAKNVGCVSMLFTTFTFGRMWPKKACGSIIFAARCWELHVSSSFDRSSTPIYSWGIEVKQFLQRIDTVRSHLAVSFSTCFFSLFPFAFLTSFVCSWLTESREQKDARHMYEPICDYFHTTHVPRQKTHVIWIRLSLCWIHFFNGFESMTSAPLGTYAAIRPSDPLVWNAKIRDNDPEKKWW